jgi:hypothetical protein
VYPSGAAMKLLLKFNILLILVFGSGLAAAAYISHQSLQVEARAEVVRQAALMMETMLSVRNYTRSIGRRTSSTRSGTVPTR